jgi:hypothetical protein
MTHKQDGRNCSLEVGNRPMAYTLEKVDYHVFITKLLDYAGIEVLTLRWLQRVVFLDTVPEYHLFLAWIILRP